MTKSPWCPLPMRRVTEGGTLEFVVSLSHPSALEITVALHPSGRQLGDGERRLHAQRHRHRDLRAGR